MEFFRRHPKLTMLASMAITLVVLRKSLLLGWVDWDDKVHIIDNPLIRSLRWDSIKQMFLSPHLNGSYIPLTELSWALNYKVGGLEPFGYHAVNLLLHLCSTGLVFILINKLTNNMAVAFLTSLLFGIHPMHVEPVAWITGRKDVLYGFFLLNSIICYTAYTKSKGVGFWALSLILFVLSLLSKGVAVVLPLLLLLVDIYIGRRLNAKLIIEKLPFFVLSLVFGLVAINAQEQTVALQSVEEVSYHITAVTSSYSLTLYLIQAIAPFQIGAFHPYPLKEAALPVKMVLSVAVPITLFCLLFVFRKRKNLVFGVGFLLVSFLPVLQFIPVGGAIVADRYTYIPYLGAFFILSYFIASFYEQRRGAARKTVVISVVGYLLFLGGTAYSATDIWSNSFSLWNNVIDQHPHDSKGYINRGRYFYDNGDLELAKKDFETALDISPELPVLHQHFGLYYQKKMMFDEALSSFRMAINLDSLYFPGWLNMAVTHMHLKQLDSALYYLESLEKLDSSNVLVHINRGVIYEQQGEFDRAFQEYGKAISKDQNDYKGFQYRAIVLYRVGRYNDATSDLEEWIKRAPRDGKPYVWRSRIRFLKEEFAEADLDINAAMELGTIVSEEYLTMLADSIRNSSQPSD